MGITLYKRDSYEELAFDHLMLTLPFIGYKASSGFLGEPEYTFGIDAPTVISYSADGNTWWNIKLRVLGFGIAYTRQRGY